MLDPFLRTHRLILWALISCFAAFLTWALIAKLDVVAVTQGKLVPSGFVQAIQPPEDGVIRTVLVKDGDQVEAGQALVELDSVYAKEDTSAAEAQVRNLEYRLARVNAELDGYMLSVPDSAVMAEFIHRKQAYAALLSEATRQLESARADLITAQQRHKKYQELLPITARQSDMLARLKAEGFVSEAALNDKLLIRLETAGEADIQARAVDTAASAVRAADASVQKVKADYQRQLSTERTELEYQLTQAKANLAKQAHRAGLQVLRAPVAGQITGLAVRSPGEFVGAGAKLLSLVPAGQPLRFEGWLRNEDSAFVMPGMPAKVKLSAYPFQKYGWLEGELSWIGVDAEIPESMRNAQGDPLFYKVRVTLPAQHLERDGTTLELRPGMQAVADLQVGKRTLFEYLTSPMRKIALEAARER